MFYILFELSYIDDNILIDNNNGFNNFSYIQIVFYVLPIISKSELLAYKLRKKGFKNVI